MRKLFAEDSDRSSSLRVSLSLHVWNTCQEESGWLAQAGLSFLSYVTSIILTIVARDYLLTNIIAALEHPDRVRCLKGKVATVTQEPFPMLTQLWLSSKDENLSVLPGAFLGGSAPCLQQIHLEGIPFPTLPSLISSATDLVVLYLHRIPHTGYISPEAMVASLATLTRLCDLSIEFQSSTSRPHQSGSRRRLAPLTRAVLPALTSFEFRGGKTSWPKSTLLASPLSG